MGKLKEQLQKIQDECTRLYQEGGVSAVIEYVNVQIVLNPIFKENVRLYHCTGCETEQPTLNNTCLVCGLAIEGRPEPEIGRKITTIGEVRKLLKDCSDDDIAILEACDEHGDVQDLYPMYIDIIEGIELLNGKTVNEVRFCQMPNQDPDDRNKEAVINSLLEQLNIDGGNKNILSSLLEYLPFETLHHYLSGH